jgi:predicted phosphodiesterase
MKIRLLSDIHQEFYEDRTLYETKGEDVLVLAGDIHVGHEAVLNAIAKFMHGGQPSVVYVPGNHEYYRYSLEYFNAGIIRSFASVLNPGTVKIGDVTFIGATGWTNFRKDRIAKMACATRISDFRLINGFSTDVCDQLSTEHFKYIFDAYAQTEGKKVIVTHFLPAVECIAPEYRGSDLLNYYFANDYGELISEMKDTTWLFGHSHSPTDFLLGSTRMVNNAYGYNMNKGFVEKIIEV